MSAAADIIAALDAETAASVAAPTALLSVTIDVVGAGAVAVTDVRVVRATKSLVFSEAETKTAAGARIMTASAVHKITR